MERVAGAFPPCQADAGGGLSTLRKAGSCTMSKTAADPGAWRDDGFFSKRFSSSSPSP